MTSNVIQLKPRNDLFENDEIISLETRALVYLNAGVPVHLRGPAGTGKTTLALQIASKLGQPVILLSGDNWLTSANLVGQNDGVQTKSVHDRYVHSVKRSETETKVMWKDSVLTEAIQNGYTLVYDEFTRSPPEANNPLLTAFEEKMLVVSSGARSEKYVKAHPDFRSILTSNPQDYAAVKIPQDALMDRMITLDIDHLSRDAEVGIIIMQSQLDANRAGKIVDIIRAVRGESICDRHISMRSAIMIAKVVANESFSTSADDPRFVQLCFDVLESKMIGSGETEEKHNAFCQKVSEAICEMCAEPEAVQSTY
ncbi:MAG: gas vesicle protein GvpN [Pseudomonadota bacterium]